MVWILNRPFKSFEGGLRQRPNLGPMLAGSERCLRPQLCTKFSAVTGHRHKFLLERGERVRLIVRQIARVVTTHDAGAAAKIQGQVVGLDGFVRKQRPLIRACGRKASQAPPELGEVAGTFGVVVWYACHNSA